jgi:hypothetical protein
MVNLKKANYWAIHDFALMKDKERIQGSKLEALYRLIQLKGSPIETEGPLNGIKALEFGSGSFVAISHHPSSPDSFFPCRIKTVHLQQLNK